MRPTVSTYCLVIVVPGTGPETSAGVVGIGTCACVAVPIAGRGRPHRSYVAALAHLFRCAAQLVGKILRGAKPTDIPVEQPTKFDLVINLKAV